MVSVVFGLTSAGRDDNRGSCFFDILLHSLDRDLAVAGTLVGQSGLSDEICL